MLLHDQLKDYRLLLASQSPRRRELNSGRGPPCRRGPADVPDVHGPKQLLSFNPSDLPHQELLRTLTQGSF